MVRRMPSSAAAPQGVHNRFRAKAQEFDDLYEDERFLVRLLRPGLFRRRELAVATVRSYSEPGVLDVGCGSGRIGELVLEAGTSRYLGVDFSEPMIDLSRRRLERFGSRVELVCNDFLEVPIEGRFDVVLALGLFDYLPDEPANALLRLFWQQLAPEGMLLVGNFAPHCPTRAFMEWIGNWYLIYRTAEDLARLAEQAGIPAPCVRIGAERLGIDLFLCAKKGTGG